MRIALIQYRADPDRQSNIDRAVHAMERAHDAGADVVAFPELAVDRFFPQHKDADARRIAEPIPGPTANRIAEMAAKHQMVTVFNMYEHDADSDRYFDSSPVFDSDGTLLGVTRMMHITDYACFHEQDYYDPGDTGAPVYQTGIGKLGVAICYDRHYPEYMRALGAGGAELVIIPQAGVIDEWPEGLYQAEVRAAAFQNGYFAALCNRVGREERLTFAGESFVVGPDGTVLATAKKSDEDLIVVDLNLDECKTSPARTLFWRDRRPELYGEWI